MPSHSMRNNKANGRKFNNPGASISRGMLRSVDTRTASNQIRNGGLTRRGGSLNMNGINNQQGGPCGPCGGDAASLLVGGVVVCRPNPKQAPTYLATWGFDTPKWSQGPDNLHAATRFAQEMNEWGSSMDTAITHTSGTLWTGNIVPATAASALVGTSAAYVGLQIQSLDNRKLIGNLTVTVYGGNVVGASPTSVVYNRIEGLIYQQAAATVFYAFMPLLKEETNTQRVDLHKQAFAFTSATEKNGIQVTVDGLPVGTEYSMQAFLASRTRRPAVLYGRQLGVQGA